MNRQPTTSWRLLAAYLRPQWQRVLLLAVLLFTSIGLQLANPQVLRTFIDRATDGAPLRTLLVIAGIFFGVALLTQVVSVSATYLSALVGWDATNRLRADLMRHCLRLDMPFHGTHTPGEMIERVDGDVTVLSNFFAQLVINVIGSGLLLIGVLALLFREDWRVGGALTLFALATFGVLLLTRSAAVPAMTAERSASADLFGFLEERLAGKDDIRANGAGGHVMRRFHQAIAVVVGAARRAQIAASGVWMGAMVMFTLGYMLALGMGAYLYQQGEVTLGTVYLFFQYTQMLRRPLEMIAEQLKEFQRAGAGITRARELLAMQSVIEDGPGAPVPAGALAVEFDDVSFAYEERDLVISDLTFRLTPGRVIGVLGRTGCGKTTLTRLLLRLYDPTAGAIRLGGVDLRAARLADLRRQIGIVTQDVQLFGASVRDNLTLFDDSIPDERIMQVLADLGLLDWLWSLPDGLDTELAPGGGLSAGEAQLLAFARVFLRDPGLVILDEASSRLDPATERLIERAVDRLLTNRTGIVIAHRLGTVQRADEIMILDRGRVQEHGPRAALARDPRSRFAGLLRTGLEEVLA